MLWPWQGCNRIALKERLANRLAKIFHAREIFLRFQNICLDTKRDNEKCIFLILASVNRQPCLSENSILHFTNHRSVAKLHLSTPFIIMKAAGELLRTRETRRVEAFEEQEIRQYWI